MPPPPPADPGLTIRCAVPSADSLGLFDGLARSRTPELIAALVWGAPGSARRSPPSAPSCGRRCHAGRRTCCGAAPAARVEAPVEAVPRHPHRHRLLPPAPAPEPMPVPVPVPKPNSLPCLAAVEQREADYRLAKARDSAAAKPRSRTREGAAREKPNGKGDPAERPSSSGEGARPQGAGREGTLRAPKAGKAEKAEKEKEKRPPNARPRRNERAEAKRLRRPPGKRRCRPRKAKAEKADQERAATEEFQAACRSSSATETAAKATVAVRRSRGGPAGTGGGGTAAQSRPSAGCPAGCAYLQAQLTFTGEIRSAPAVVRASRPTAPSSRASC